MRSILPDPSQHERGNRARQPLLLDTTTESAKSLLGGALVRRSSLRYLRAERTVVEEAKTELLTTVDAALQAGVDEDRLVIDPGLGFAKYP